MGMAVLYAVDTRADLLGASDVLEEAALDPYEFTRDAYLQKRLNDIHDGEPPREEQTPSMEEEMFRDLETPE
jgi:phospholipid-binding lipoprotein MlaA